MALKMVVEPTEVKRFGRYTIGIYFNKALVSKFFGWDEGTKLEERYDLEKGEVVIRKKGGESHDIKQC